MKVFILVKMFQGIVDDVEVFEIESDAVEAWDEFVEGITYEEASRNDDSWHDFHQYNDKYTGTKIYETMIVKKGHLLDSRKVQ